MIKIIITGLICVAAIVIADIALSAEKDYQLKHCEGQIEYVLPDRTRVDCLTETHAIEYDYGHKWAEAVGQSLHYAMHTGKRAGIVLIIAHDEYRFLQRAKFVVNHYNLPIDVWEVSK